MSAQDRPVVLYLAAVAVALMFNAFTTTLPVLNMLKALATPVIAMVGVYIASQQKRQGDIRLQIERYDRRYAIFAAARDLLGKIQQKGNANGNDYFEFKYKTGEAVFLTNADVVRYIDQLGKKTNRLVTLTDMQTIDDEDRNARITEKERLVGWFSEQYDVLIEKFKPLLSFEA